MVRKIAAFATLILNGVCLVSLFYNPVYSTEPMVVLPLNVLTMLLMNTGVILLLAVIE